VSSSGTAGRSNGKETVLTILLIILVILLLFGGFGYSRRGRGGV
jgi:hypothetical protein